MSVEDGWATCPNCGGECYDEENAGGIAQWPCEDCKAEQEERRRTREAYRRAGHDFIFDDDDEEPF